VNKSEPKRRLDDDQLSKAALLHDLEVQQIELEVQNQQLKESQQELEEARDRYADLYDHAPVGYLTLDMKGEVMGINLTGAGMLGKERSYIVGHSFVNLLTTPSIQPFLAHLRQVLTEPGNSVIEILFKAKEGLPRLVRMESVAVPFVEGEQRTCRSVMTDVTDQRKLGVELQVISSAQDALLNAIPALVFYLDHNLHFLNISQAFSDFVGRTVDEIVGKTVFDIFPSAVANEFNEIYTSVLNTGTALYGYENCVTDQEGGQVYLSSVITPFRNFQGKTIGLVGVSVDISMIKSVSNSNSDLLAQNRRLTRKLFEAQEAERRNLAHELHDELGQWFTAIQAEAHIICNLSKDQPKIQESALAIRKSVITVHDVIRDMLRKLRPSMLDELGLEDSLSAMFRPWCHSHPDVVCKFLLDAPLEGLGEEVNITIYRLIQEALNNIANYSRADEVLVRFDLDTSEEDESKFLLLKIQDNGVGFKLDEVKSGMGVLGMRERVISSGGKFAIDSVEGKGTTITVSFPLHEK